MNKLFAYILEYILIINLNLQSIFIKNPPKQWSSGDKGTIILLPGLYETWIFLAHIADKLSKNGYKITVLKSLNYNLNKPSYYSKIIESYLQNITSDKIFLLSHSKGGLVAKYFLDNSKYSKRITKVFSIATPYHGTSLGLFSIFIPDYLKLNSPTLNLLNKNCHNNNRIVSIFTKHDNHVQPYTSAILENANNFEIKTVGHTRILFSLETINVIKKYIN